MGSAVRLVQLYKAIVTGYKLFPKGIRIARIKQ